MKTNKQTTEFALVVNSFGRFDETVRIITVNATDVYEALLQCDDGLKEDYDEAIEDGHYKDLKSPKDFLERNGEIELKDKVVIGWSAEEWLVSVGETAGQAALAFVEMKVKES